ncbi:hypothetical protein D9M72_130050 [compost metagenome]
MSSMLLAIGPGVSRVCEMGVMPEPSYRPTEGRKPAAPLTAAGRRTEAPVSVPRAAGVRRAPTAAPLPEDEPPAMRVLS